MTTVVEWAEWAATKPPVCNLTQLFIDLVLLLQDGVFFCPRRWF